jgi:hypothetical protein
MGLSFSQSLLNLAPHGQRLAAFSFQTPQAVPQPDDLAFTAASIYIRTKREQSDKPLGIGVPLLEHPRRWSIRLDSKEATATRPSWDCASSHERCRRFDPVIAYHLFLGQSKKMAPALGLGARWGHLR